MSEEKVSLSPNQQVVQVPGASVPLPSQGLVYPVGNPLANRESLEIKMMTAKEEDILTSRVLIKNGRVLDALLRSCVLDRSVDVDKMLTGDRNALLVSIRITGYGEKYNVEFTCPACNKQSPFEFDLSRLPIKRLGAAPIAPNVNEFEFILPVSGVPVHFKLLTGEEERSLAADLDKSRSIGGESLVTTRLLSQIVSIGGEKDPSKVSQLVRNMPARDSRALRTWMDKVSPGVDMKQTFVCSSCDHTSEEDVPMGTEFFWPST